MQQIVNDGEACLFDHCGCLYYLRGCGASLESSRDCIKGGIGCGMQFLVNLAWLPESEAAQNLARVLPKCGADFGYRHIASLHSTQARELAGHAKLGHLHRGDADIMNDVGRAVRNVDTLDQISQLALVQARLQPVAQRRHTKVAEMRADAKPIEFFGGFDLTQTDVIAIETFQLSKFCRQSRVLFRADRSDCRNPVLSRASLLKNCDRCRDRRFTAPRDIRLLSENARLRRVIDILYEQRIALVRREYSHRLRSHRPLRQPLDDRAEPIGAAKHKVIAFSVSEEILDGGAATRHFRFGKTRVFGLDNTSQMSGEGRHDISILSWPGLSRPSRLSWHNHAIPSGITGSRR